jgi:hypothetical protein
MSGPLVRKLTVAESAAAAELVLSCIYQATRVAVETGVRLPALEKMLRESYSRALEERKTHGCTEGIQKG